MLVFKGPVMRDSSPMQAHVFTLIYNNEDMNPGESLMTVVATKSTVVRGPG